MKIAHFADTHLGYAGPDIQEYVSDPFHPGSLITQHAADILHALRQTVDLILESRPDIAIHAGDVFDSARPSPSVVEVALRELGRIPQAGIPLVIVEGNHSYPRDRAAGHALQLLTFLGIQVVCDDQQTLPLPGLPLTIHALPHAALQSRDGIVPKPVDLDPDRRHVLVTHGIADNVPFYKTHRYAPPVLLAACSEMYDYIALGHYHHFCQANLRPRAFYAGASTMITWGDFAAGDGFSFNLVELTDGEPIVERRTIPGRPMHAYGLDDAREYSATEIFGFLERQRDAMPPDGAYCFVRVLEINLVTSRELDRRRIEDLFEAAAVLRVECRSRVTPWTETALALRDGGTPLDRFVRLAESTEGDDAFRSAVADLGKSLLERAAEELAAAGDT